MGVGAVRRHNVATVARSPGLAYRRMYEGSRENERKEEKKKGRRRAVHTAIRAQHATHSHTAKLQ